VLELRAAIWAFPVPQAPPGFKVLAEIRTPTACIRFPSSLSLGIETSGSSDTTFYTWTPENTSGITMFAVDSALYSNGGTSAQRDSSNQAVWPYDGAALFAVGYTANFVPGVSPGWTVAFPSTSADGLAAPGMMSAGACTP
jgi:hypothetical protein